MYQALKVAIFFTHALLFLFLLLKSNSNLPHEIESFIEVISANRIPESHREAGSSSGDAESDAGADPFGADTAGGVVKRLRFRVDEDGAMRLQADVATAVLMAKGELKGLGPGNLVDQRRPKTLADLTAGLADVKVQSRHAKLRFANE